MSLLGGSPAGAFFILATKNMEDQSESFNFKENIDGKEHDYRITMNDCKYSVEQDGILVAKIQYDDTGSRFLVSPYQMRLLNL